MIMKNTSEKMTKNEKSFMISTGVRDRRYENTMLIVTGYSTFERKYNLYRERKGKYGRNIIIILLFYFLIDRTNKESNQIDRKDD